MENVRKVGEKLKEVRKMKGMTLQYLSESTNLSIGYLSNLERNQCSPTLNNLKIICDTFKITISELIEEDVPKKILIRDEDTTTFRHDHYPMTYKQVNFYECYPIITTITLDPHIEFDGHLYRHPYFEIGTVLKGKLCMEMDGIHYELKEGDSILVRANTLHSTYNPYDETCVTMWIENRNKEKNSDSH